MISKKRTDIGAETRLFLLPGMKGTDMAGVRHKRVDTIGFTLNIDAIDESLWPKVSHPKREQTQADRDMLDEIMKFRAEALHCCGIYPPVTDENGTLSASNADADKNENWITVKGTPVKVEKGELQGKVGKKIAESSKKPFPKGALSSKDVVKFLKSEGFFLDRQKGSHATYQDKNGHSVTVPMHGNESIKKPTLESIKKQAGYK